MNRADVAAVLREENFHFVHDFHGFTLTIDPANPYRLKHGGGIAGRSNVWWIEHVRNGSPLYGSEQKVTTRSALRRLLREYATYMSYGQKPADRFSDGVHYTFYAKLNRRGGDENYVWVMRRARRPS